MATAQTLADRIREQINDDSKRRVPDSELLNYINDCSKALLNKRPDLRIGSLATTLTDLALGGTWPWPDVTIPAVIQYGIAMAEAPDDESADNPKSERAMKRFLHEIYGD